MSKRLVGQVPGLDDRRGGVREEASDRVCVDAAGERDAVGSAAQHGPDQGLLIGERVVGAAEQHLVAGGVGAIPQPVDGAGEDGAARASTQALPAAANGVRRARRRCDRAHSRGRRSPLAPSPASPAPPSRASSARARRSSARRRPSRPRPASSTRIRPACSPSRPLSCPSPVDVSNVIDNIRHHRPRRAVATRLDHREVGHAE